MIRAFFLIAFVLLCFKAPCQSITLSALTDSLIFTDNRAYLIPKGFALITQVADQSTFKKNENTPFEEELEFSKGASGYISKDINYIKSLLKLAGTKFKKTVTTHIYRNNHHSKETVLSREFTNGKLHLAFAIFSDYALIAIDFIHP